MRLWFGIHLAPGLFLSHEELGKVTDLAKMVKNYRAETMGAYDSAVIADNPCMRSAPVGDGTWFETQPG
jgi:hypothetical protein